MTNSSNIADVALWGLYVARLKEKGIVSSAIPNPENWGILFPAELARAAMGAIINRR